MDNNNKINRGHFICSITNNTTSILNGKINPKLDCLFAYTHDTSKKMIILYLKLLTLIH